MSLMGWCMFMVKTDPGKEGFVVVVVLPGLFWTVFLKMNSDSD